MSPLHHRGLGSISPKNNNFTPEQVLITQIVAITCASLSLIMTLIASYWFIRMRKSFRHKLIMLLILSDMFKALWYFTFPLVAFARGPIPSKSAFCKITGFCVSFGTEASDVAILMIAIHASLYVFHSKTSGTEAGLYPHRYTAYACWVIYATLMASLAFVNPVNAYQSSGTFCSLPVRPFWYRLALSWIPRYLILLTVIGLYIAIYVYVHVKFKGIDAETSDAKRSSNNQPKPSSSPANSSERPATAIIPKIVMRRPTSLARHGLIPSDDTVPSNRSSAGEKPVWENYDFGGSQPVSPLPESQSTLLVPLAGRPKSSRIVSDEMYRRASTASDEPRGNYFLINALNDSRIKSFAPTYETDDTVAASGGESSASGTALGNSTGNFNSQSPNGNGDVGSTSLRRRHRAIKLKLRLLFIYPIAYTCMWLVPFAQHCLQYSDYYSENPPYPLAVLTVALLASQGTVDSLVFTIRERPWRYVGKGRLFPWGKPLDNIESQRRYSGNASALGGSADERLEGEPQGITGIKRVPGVQNSRETVKAAKKLVGGSSSLRNSDESVPSAKKGSIKEKSWWEMEGRIRMDSVLLGTDRIPAEHESAGQRGSVQLGSVIREEEESGQSVATGDTGAVSDGFEAARRGYGGLHGGWRDSTGTGHSLPIFIRRDSDSNDGQRRSYGFTEYRRPSAAGTTIQRGSASPGLEEVTLADLEKN